MSTELNGFYEDMDFESYAAVPALNGSSIVSMRRSPMAYKHNKDNPSPPSAAMQLGTITHRMILEPELVGKIAVWGLLPDEKVRNGRVWNDFKVANADKTILHVNDYITSTSMAKAALENVPIKQYAAAEGTTEVSMFWRHPHTKRRYKARVDKICLDPLTIIDLKTTRDSRPHKFSNQAYSLGYVVKMANYWNGYRILTGKEPAVKLLAIDSKAPHEGVVYNVARDLLLLGLEELDQLVARLDECEAENKWPPAETEECDLDLPPWASAESETELDLEA
jgi:hypothetical protein